MSSGLWYTGLSPTHTADRKETFVFTVTADDHSLVVGHRSRTTLLWLLPKDFKHSYLKTCERFPEVRDIFTFPSGSVWLRPASTNKRLFMSADTYIEL